MATPAQAAAATVGAGSLAAAGAYGITQAVNSSGEETNTEEQETTSENNEMPNEVSVFADTDVSTEPYSNKLISFIKQANLSSLVKPEDQKWWDWAFTNKYEKLKVGKQAHTVFASVTSSETLKTACDSAYKAEKTDYSFEADHHLLQNISDYCTKTTNSIDISEPKAEVYQTQQRDETYKKGVLSISSNAAVLVKKDAGTTNDLWWKWAFIKLYQPNKTDVNDVFKDTAVNEGFKDSGTTALNQVCDATYKKTYSDLKTTSNKLLKNIKQFCSTDRTNTELTLPEPFLEDTSLIKTSDSPYTTNKIVKTNASKLVDPTKEQDWWDWTFKNVFQPYKTTNSSLADPFNKTTINKGYAQTTANGGAETSVDSLNKACKEAYKKESDWGKVATANSLIKLIEKFCVPSYKGSLVDASAS